jgi:hypothetical protein
LCQTLLGPLPERSRIPLPPFYTSDLDPNHHRHVFTLVLDLDETLVHASVSAAASGGAFADGGSSSSGSSRRRRSGSASSSTGGSLQTSDEQQRSGTVELRHSDRSIRSFAIAKRPHLDHFLEQVAPFFEICVFTASIRRYADPVIDLIDPNRYVSRRFYRESCGRLATLVPPQSPHTGDDGADRFGAYSTSSILTPNGSYTKDLTHASRDLARTILIDDSPTAGLLQPGMTPIFIFSFSLEYAVYCSKKDLTHHSFSVKFLYHRARECLILVLCSQTM